jgi:hypothetical protein
VRLHVLADVANDAGVDVDELFARLARLAGHAGRHHDDVSASHRLDLVGRDEVGVVEAFPRSALGEIEGTAFG